MYQFIINIKIFIICQNSVQKGVIHRLFRTNPKKAPPNGDALIAVYIQEQPLLIVKHFQHSDQIIDIFTARRFHRGMHGKLWQTNINRRNRHLG